MSFFDDIAKDIGKVVQGVVGDVEQAMTDIEHGIVDGVRDIGKAIQIAIQTGQQVIGTVVSGLGGEIEFVVDGTGYVVGDLIGVQMRTLSLVEKNTLRAVFGASLPR